MKRSWYSSDDIFQRSNAEMLEMCIYELLETKLGRDRTTLRTTRDAAAVATFAYNLRGESPRSIVLLNNLMLWQVQSSTNRLEDHILIAYSHHQNKSWKYEIQPVTNPTTIPAQILTNIALERFELKMQNCCRWEIWKLENEKSNLKTCFQQKLHSGGG